MHARYVNPKDNFPKTSERYSGLAESNIPMKTVYDRTVALSIVSQGKFMMASTRDECVRSNRETT